MALEKADAAFIEREAERLKLLRAQTINNMFTYHRPFGDQPQRYEELRTKARELAHLIVASCPDSRERSLAITNLQQAIMWANAGIAINEVE